MTVGVASQPGSPGPEPRAGSAGIEALQAIDRTKDGGATLQFNRRNAVETIGLHAGLTAFTALIVGLWVSGVAGAVDGSVWVVLALMLVVAVVASVLSVRSFRRGDFYSTTDVWDGLCGTGQLLAASMITVWTGGVSSPMWIVVLLAAAYLATVLVYASGWIIVGLLAVAAPVSGWLSGTVSAAMVPAETAWTVALTVGMPAVFMIVRGVSRSLYEAAEGTAWQQAVVSVQVRELADVLGKVSQGDLSPVGRARHGEHGARRGSRDHPGHRRAVLGLRPRGGESAGVGGADSWGW